MNDTPFHLLDKQLDGYHGELYLWEHPEKDGLAQQHTESAVFGQQPT